MVGTATTESIATYIVNVINFTQSPESDLYINVGTGQDGFNYYTINGVVWITVPLNTKLLTIQVCCWNQLMLTTDGVTYTDVVLSTDDRITELTEYLNKFVT